MKKEFLPIYFAFYTLFSCFHLYGQNTAIHKNSFQMTAGFAISLHYDQPISMLPCLEGCYAEKQRPALAKSMAMSYYRHFNNRNAVKIGLGFSQYRYWEEGLASPGDNTLLPYERIFEHHYFNLMLGYRFSFWSRPGFEAYFEPEVVYERGLNEELYLLNNAWAAKGNFGVIIPVNGRLRINTNLFYKTGLSRYNTDYWNNSLVTYIPFAAGLDIGVSVGF